MNPIIIGVDFDGTIVSHAFPGIGEDLGGLFWLQTLKNMGCEFFLWTCRPGARLKEAEAWLEVRGYGEVFASVNEKTPHCPIPDDPRKVFANIYVDDRGLGAPIKIYADGQKAPHFDWGKAGPALVKMVEAMQKVRS